MRKTINMKIPTILVIAILIVPAVLLTIPVMPVNATSSLAQPTTGAMPAGVTANYTRSTTAQLSFRPNPVGKGETFMVNLWTTPALAATRFHHDYTVTITKPDGTKNVLKMDSFQADATSWFEYIADQVGNWTIKFDFLGTYFPAGYYFEGKVYASLAEIGNYSVGNSFAAPAYIDSAYYEPSSTQEQTLVVTDNAVYSWPEQPFLTSYWTRPIEANGNREWWPYAGNYPDYYFNSELPIWNQLYPGTSTYWGSNYGFYPWVQGANSAHIVWQNVENPVAGFTGPDMTLASTGSATNPTLVYLGRAYSTQTVQWYNGSFLSCACCYDIRTGQMYYEIPTAAPFNGITPNIVQYHILAPNWISPDSNEAVPGGSAGTAPGESKIENPSLLSISGSYLRTIDPKTGALTGNYSIAPLSGGTYYKNGYVLTIQDLGAAAGSARYRLINWTTFGTLANLTTSTGTRIVSNTTYSRSALVTLCDYGVMKGASVSELTTGGAYSGINITGIDMKTGDNIWSKFFPDETQYSGSCNVADHGKLAVLTQQGYFICLDLNTGNTVWTSDKMTYPWGSTSFGAYAIQSAYGMIFRQSYDAVYAFNWTDGKIVWRYEAPALSAYEAPYIGENGTTVYCFNSGGKIADGKMYVTNSEHSATYPLTRGWGLHCINITTGELIWKINHVMTAGVISDGYVTATDSYTGTMYVFGKGQSAATVEGPMTAITLGQSLMIKGSVLDLSPAQAGTACVSKDSMTTQMEYLHLQRPIGGLWGNETMIGVPVSLDTVDSNGNPLHIATVTTEGYSGTFGYMWKPEMSGTYQITASFAGDDSYGSSLATTTVGVTDAAATSTPVPTQPAAAVPPFETYFAITAIVIILAIAVATVLLLRKRA
jgi:outer membrane protein assembly factor BamB